MLYHYYEMEDLNWRRPIRMSDEKTSINDDATWAQHKYNCTMPSMKRGTNSWFQCAKWCDTNILDDWMRSGERVQNNEIQYESKVLSTFLRISSAVRNNYSDRFFSKLKKTDLFHFLDHFFNAVQRCIWRMNLCWTRNWWWRISRTMLKYTIAISSSTQNEKEANEAITYIQAIFLVKAKSIKFIKHHL